MLCACPRFIHVPQLDCTGGVLSNINNSHSAVHPGNSTGVIWG